MEPVTYTVLEGGMLQASLRPIRLYHWLQCLKHRRKAAKAKYKNNTLYHNQLAMRHLANVQVLNEFFPIGDTAEADASKTML